MAKVIVFGSLPESLINFRGTLLEVMVSLGHEVHAISMSADSLVAKRLSDMGVKYHAIPVQRTGLNPLKDMSGLFVLFQIFRRIRPDYVLAYTIKPVIYGGLVAKLFRVRFYAMITGMGYAFNDKSLKGRLIGALVRILFRLSLSNSKCVLFHNENDLKVFQKACMLSLQDRYAIIKGSGVDLDYFTPQPYPKKISFLMIARLLEDKGVYEYVEAARQLKRNHPHLQFRLAGWIDENPKAISRTELEKWVYDGVIDYLGYLDDVRPAIADSSVYVLPSYHEGLPRTVLEAMAMARPVITTDVPGCRDTVIDGETGYLVRVRDAGAICSAMERFLENPGLVPDMGAEGLRFARDVFDVRGINQRILETMELVSETSV
jgi:glycosyltransferase involved in cell wall biosynthesis